MIVDDAVRAFIRHKLESGWTETATVAAVVKQRHLYPGYVTGQFVRDRYTVKETVQWAVRDIAARKARADMEAELRAEGRLHKEAWE